MGIDGMMYNPKVSIVRGAIKPLLILGVMWFIFGCSLGSLKLNVEPIAAGVTEFSPCHKDGKPTEVFSPDEERIFVCGYVQTLQPIDIDIRWYY